MLHHLDLIRQATFMEPLVHVVFPPHDRRNCRNSIRCYTCRRWGHVAASCHFLSHTNPLFWRAKITQSGNTQSDAVGTFEFVSLGSFSYEWTAAASHKNILFSDTGPVFCNATRLPDSAPMAGGASSYSPPLFASFSDMHRVLFGKVIINSDPSSSSTRPSDKKKPTLLHSGDLRRPHH